MRKLIAGNWKMNGLRTSSEVIAEIARGLEGADIDADCLICPPFTLAAAFADQAKGTALKIGAQNCHSAVSGAHTGDVSAQMLADIGVSHVILGHSERRADHGELSTDVASKAGAVCDAGLIPIICVGESLSDREAGLTSEVVLGQLDLSVTEGLAGHPFVIAYEPIWAIGTGLTASAEQIAGVHLAIRDALISRFGTQGEAVQILYGGSMKPANATEILAVANVDGGLIGGASLKAADFLAIFRSVS
jgi:triosephosphate isomerase